MMKSGEETVSREVWSNALKAAQKVEKRYGKANLGPWDDFEWGMIKGKLSALRWVLGGRMGYVRYIIDSDSRQEVEEIYKRLAGRGINGNVFSTPQRR
jgi:hypothetical protein